jgi:hypothetical protein
VIRRIHRGVFVALVAASLAAVSVPGGHAVPQAQTITRAEAIAIVSRIMSSSLECAYPGIGKAGGRVTGYSATAAGSGWKVVAHIYGPARPGFAAVRFGITFIVQSETNVAAGDGAATKILQCAGITASATPKWPKLPDAKVLTSSVSNGCSPSTSGAPSDPKWADTATFTEPTTSKRYTVSFRGACDQLDAGYVGAKVYDDINWKVVDYWSYDREAVDAKFLKDMRHICSVALGGSALAAARAACRGLGQVGAAGALARYHAVRAGGWYFYGPRIDLNGVWVTGTPSDPSLAIEQKGRQVRAVWRGGAGAPGTRGQFKGTLVSKDEGDTVVKGYGLLTEPGAEAAFSPMTLTIDGTHRKRMIVKGPGDISGTFAPQ